MNDEDETRDEPEVTDLEPGELENTLTAAPPSSGAVAIGKYRLLQKVGEGGMGEVYQAEQQQPVRRTVALKLIKPGMDSRRVVARFESERQALALMNHPNIAHVFDAGVTPDNRPFFAMEYVKGVPISKYCDQQRLDTDQRLKLFMQVCSGVQHAHQKGIIHRDIKPSNVLVTVDSAEPVPKIIDFGVAKATDHRLVEETLFTELGQIIGTPEYMSPEQAELTGLDVDTRSDVYSLGVLLYELLVGELPFDSHELRKAGFDGLRRIIREEDPPLPSTRITTLGERTTATARNRRSDPIALSKELRGDLDCIVMKTLEKDRTRRYETADALAKDIRRHLDHQPVYASPPSTAYRVRKFVRRNRVVVASGALIFVALLSGLTLAAIGLLQASRERDHALTAEASASREAKKATAISSFLVKLLSSVDPDKAQGREVTVREVLDKGATRVGDSFAEQPSVEVELRHAIGTTYSKLGLYTDAEPQLRRSLELSRQTHGPEHPETLKAMNALGFMLFRHDRADEAEQVWVRELEIRRRTLGPDHRTTLNASKNLAAVYLQQERFKEAEPLFLETLAGQRRTLGEDHRSTQTTKSNLAQLYDKTERYEEAEPLYAEILDLRLREYGETNSRTLISKYNLADFYMRQDRFGEAITLSAGALQGFQKIVGDTHEYTLLALRQKFEILLRQEEYEEAENLGLDCYERHRQKFGANDRRTVATAQLLVELYEQLSRPSRVREWQARLGEATG